jgi:small subunit ribosomal protein S11
MGKKRIIKKSGISVDSERRSRSLSRLPKKKVTAGVLHVQSTYNNTKMLLSDVKGGVLVWSSSGAIGFKGAKKGTPFAGSKVAELIAEKAEAMGVKDVDIIVKGVGGGRESAIRTFVSKGFSVGSIKDATPVPHNGPRPKKPRRG